MLTSEVIPRPGHPMPIILKHFGYMQEAFKQGRIIEKLSTKIFFWRNKPAQVRQWPYP
jgi:hypothetical protein